LSKLSKISLVIAAGLTAVVLGILIPEAKAFQAHPSGWEPSHSRWEQPRHTRHPHNGGGGRRSTSVPAPPTVIATGFGAIIGAVRARKKREVIAQ
jgi:hypothetical protein